jgi:hypothetical protein
LVPGSQSNLSTFQALHRALSEVAPHVQKEQQFVADFLHLHSLDRYIPFADYMELETYFRRAAAAQVAVQGRFKDVRSAMDLIFGFLPTELAGAIDQILQRDPT